MIRTMRVATGTIVAGRVVIDGAPFEDGASVTVIAADDRETFELGPEDEATLLAAIAEADREEVIEGAERSWELLVGCEAYAGPRKSLKEMGQAMDVAGGLPGSKGTHGSPRKKSQ